MKSIYAGRLRMNRFVNMASESFFFFFLFPCLVVGGGWINFDDVI